MKILMDCKTGEVLKEIGEGETIKIVKKEEKQVKIKEERFVKEFEVKFMLGKSLPNAEYNLINKLSCFISYDDCVLRKGGHKNGKILTLKDISEMYGADYKHIRTTFNKLKQKGLVGVHETGNINSQQVSKVITVNPYVFCRGEKVDKAVVSFYNKSGWKEKILGS